MKLNQIIEQIPDIVKWLKSSIEELKSVDNLPIAPSKKIEIQTNGPSKLYLYSNTFSDKEFEKPLIFLVPSLINRPFIFDLIPGRSFIEYLVKENFKVYLLDWGVPGHSEIYLRFEDYIFNFLHESVERIKYDNKRKKIPIMGYCIGGTLSMVYTGLFPQNISSLINLASPADFSSGGILRKFVDESKIDIEKIVEAEGNIPPKFMYLVFSMLKPTSRTTAFRFYLERRDDPEFQIFHRAMEYWTSYNIPFPGRFGITYINDFYKDNKLIKKELVYNGKTVDLGGFYGNFLNIYSINDHIVPVDAAKAAESLMTNAKISSWEFDTGHVGLLVSSYSKKNLWKKLKEWMLQHQ